MNQQMQLYPVIESLKLITTMFNSIEDENQSKISYAELRNPTRFPTSLSSTTLIASVITELTAPPRYNQFWIKNTMALPVSAQGFWF